MQPVRVLVAMVCRSAMLSPSLALVLLVVGTGLVAVAVLVYAFVRGWIDENVLERQKVAIFDVEDLRTERPWESAEQCAERRRLYGPPIEPPQKERAG